MCRLTHLLLILIVTAALTQISCSSRAEAIGNFADKARAEAAKWQSDARLVDVEVSGFGFATDKSGMPDMTKAGPPGMIIFHFYSPSTRQAMRVTALPKLTPEQEKFMEQHGGGALKSERLPQPY